MVDVRRFLALSLLAFPLAAQTPLQIVVSWPPLKLVEQKYGHIPKWAVFGEVTGCNQGTTNITYGEGDVIAAVAMPPISLQAFSRQDAFSLVANSQGASKKNIILGWTLAATSSVVDAKAAGLIGAGTTTGVAIVTGALFARILLKDSSSVLSLRQVIAYSQDGLQATMSIPAGRCAVPASVLFASRPGIAAAPAVFRLTVPPDR